MLKAGGLLYAVWNSCPLIDLERKFLQVEWWWWIDDDDRQTLIAWPSLTGCSQASTAKKIGPTIKRPQWWDSGSIIICIRLYEILYYLLYCLYPIAAVFFLFHHSFYFSSFSIFLFRRLLTCHNVNRNWSQSKTNSRRSICLQPLGLGLRGHNICLVYILSLLLSSQFFFYFFVFFNFILACPYLGYYWKKGSWALIHGLVDYALIQPCIYHGKKIILSINIRF